MIPCSFFAKRGKVVASANIPRRSDFDLGFPLSVRFKVTWPYLHLPQASVLRVPWFDTGRFRRAIFWPLRPNTTTFRIGPGMTGKGKEQNAGVASLMILRRIFSIPESFQEFLKG